MKAPQIIMIIILAAGVTLGLVHHGEPKTGRESVWSSIIAASILSLILYWGGFWS